MKNEINSIHGPIGIKLGGKISSRDSIIYNLLQLTLETYKK